MSDELQTQPTTLIRYVEVWTPTSDGKSLQRRSACAVDSNDWPHNPPAKIVKEGDGVAGRAWHQKSATILQEEPSELLTNLSRQCGASLTSVLAIPVFEQARIRGVVILGLGAGYGGTEIWSRDDRDELSVTVACYSGLPSFEFMNRYVRFPKGSGIPGQIWQSGVPQLVQDLTSNEAFVRTFDNDPARLRAAIGIPVGYSHGFPASILLLLSSEQTPLASAIELWHCEQLPLEEDMAVPRIRLTGCSVLGTDGRIEPQPWQHCLAKRIGESRTPMLFTANDANLPDGLSVALCIPIFRSGKLVEVVNLMTDINGQS
jgi:hypothetical protein